MLSFKLRWGWKQLPLKLSKRQQGTLLRIIYRAFPGMPFLQQLSQLQCAIAQASLISSDQFSSLYRTVVLGWLNNTSQAFGMLTDFSTIIINQALPTPLIIVMQRNDLPGTVTSLLVLLGLQALAPHISVNISPRVNPHSSMSLSVEGLPGNFPNLTESLASDKLLSKGI